MPELPEVETIRRDLRGLLVGKKITDVTIRKAKMVRGAQAQLRKEVIGQKVGDIERIGKLLMVKLEPSQRYLLLHLKMTGQLIYRDAADTVAGGHPWPPIDLGVGGKGLPNKFTHVIFSFAKGAKLYFNDLRQFGFVQVVSNEAKELLKRTYGIEPLTKDFTFENFRDALIKREAPLKNVLLNQAIIAGLGNIYADEVCFAAGVRPVRHARTLTHDELKKLHRACTRIIRAAIAARGTTFNHFRDSRGNRGNYVRYLKVYGRGGEPCVRPACRQAGAMLVRTKINGRGTVYCPRCQK